jgi:ABC-type amino acid transport substrate-binding protein
MKRNLFSLLILLSLLLAACGGAATPTAAPPTEAPAIQPTAVPTEAPPPEPTAEPTAIPPEPTPEPTAVPQETEAPAEAGVPRTLRLPDLEGRTVVAVTGNDYTPLNFVDPLTGEAVGWEYDAVNEICRRLNCAVDWQVTSWETMIAAVQEGQFDVGMDGITITEERAEQVDFSDPYLVSQMFMLVRADEERFSTPEEFAADPELLIGSQTGTTNFYVGVYEVLDGDEANPRIILLENFGAAVQALIAGDVDMVLMDAASSRGYIGANPDQLKTVGDPLGTEEFGFIFTPDSDLVAPFNAAIQTMKDDGFLEHLNTRWFFLYDPTQ